MIEDLGEALKKTANDLGVSEAHILERIDNIVGMLAPSFVFGYYGLDDMKQQGRIFGIQCLPRYDPKRKLENFLYRHIKNQFINFKRKEFRRNDPPCPSCHNCVDGHTEHVDKQYCKKYRKWLKRNNTKSSLMSPINITRASLSNNSSVERNYSSDGAENIEIREILQLIDRELPVSLRDTYLQMRAGVVISKTRKAEVEAFVRELLERNGCCE